jgi:hypothetical protein
MLKKLPTRFSSIFTNIAFVLVVFFSMSDFNCSHDIDYSGGILNTSPETTFRPDETLPYYKYKAIEDSINDQHVRNRSRLRDQGSSNMIGSVGITTITECDTCRSGNHFTESQQGKHKYYFILQGYKVKTPAYFSIENGENYLEYPVRSTDPQEPGWVFDYKKINIRYAHDPDDESSEARGMILIPISGRTHSFLRVVFGILSVIMVIVLFVVFATMGLRTLYNITTGEVFNRQNIRGLTIIGWLLLGVALLPPILAVLFKWIFSRIIPPPFYYPFWESIQNNKPALLAGIIILLLAKAFKKGYRLQNEQDLTI